MSVELLELDYSGQHRRVSFDPSAISVIRERDDITLDDGRTEKATNILLENYTFIVVGSYDEVVERISNDD